MLIGEQQKDVGLWHRTRVTGIGSPDHSRGSSRSRRREKPNPSSSFPKADKASSNNNGLSAGAVVTGANAGGAASVAEGGAGGA
jgi:hypothetical protein